MSAPSDNLSDQLAQLRITGNMERELLALLTAQQQQIRELLSANNASSTVKEPRPVDPQKFSGSSMQETPDFLSSVRNVFKLCPRTFSTDEQKKGYLGSLLIGSARSWFRVQSEKSDFDLLTFDEFETFFRRRFGDPFAKLTAQRKIYSLRQGSRSALTYATEFYELSQEAEFNYSAMISGLYQGLNEEVKDAMAFLPDRPETFSEYSQLVISVDNRLFERRNEKKGRAHQQVYSGFSKPQGKNAAVGQESKAGDDPMDVDVARRGGVSEPEKDRRRRLGLCFYCGTAGHLAVVCPVKTIRVVDTNKGEMKSSYCLRLPIIIKPYDVVVYALIDSGATGNFIDKSLATRLGLPCKLKKTPCSISLADGTMISDHITEEVTLQLAVQTHEETLTLDIGCFPKNQIILGMPWLTRHNPVIDFRTNILTFLPRFCKQCLVERSINVPLYNEGVVQSVVTVPTIDKDVMLLGSDGDSRTDDEGIRLPDEDITEGTRIPDDSPRISDIESDSPTSSEVSDSVSSIDQTYSEEIKTDSCTGESSMGIFELPENVPEKYRDFARVFSKTQANLLPAQRPYDCPIELKDDAIPPFKPIYNLTQPEMKALQTYIQENLQKGFIRPSSSPAGAPIFFVPKKGGELRPCVDYRGLNSITIKNRFPLPLLDNMIDRLSGAKIFTKIDLRGAYNLVRVRKGDEWKTAFRCRYGHFEYAVMPFGLTNAPAVFQGMMNDILADYLDHFVINYLDDILVYSSDPETHTTHVRKVLERLLQHQLYVKAEKCSFDQTEVTFLGFVISSKGIRMDPEKTSAIRDWSMPNSLSSLRSFLGFANFYRRFISNYSIIAAPLTSLTSTTKPFVWNDEATKAFRLLQKALQDDVTLQYPDYSQQFVLQTDASDLGIGAVLLQNDRPVAFHSRKLTDAESNYAAYDKELLAIVSAFSHWRHHLVGSSHPIIVQSDHQNLRYFAQKQILNQRHARWAVLLSEYDFRIEYLPGINNNSADALSRRFEPELGDGASVLLNERCWQSTDSKHEVSLVQTLVEDDARKLDIVKTRHDSITAGHFGVRKTYDLVARDFVWPGMRRYIADYVASCVVCQRNKVSRQKPLGLLQPLPIPEQPWRSVSMDFIVKLPVSDGFDSIMVVVDRLTKQAHFVPCREDMDAAATANLYLSHIFKLHGLPGDIVSDRGPQFKSHFWKALWTLLGSTPKMSSSYHPETDGQTERVNQTLEQFLRNYISGQHHEWVSLLPFTEFAYNNAEHVALGCSPFFANYQFNPRADYCSPSFEGELSVPAANSRLKLFRSTMKIIQDNLRQAQEDARMFADRHRRSISFNVGDKVWLSTNNLQVANRKLASKFLGPFTIISIINEVAVRLDIPDYMKIHPVVHVSRVKPFVPNSIPGRVQTPAPIEIAEDVSEWVVEDILRSRRRGGTVEYLVKWEGFGESDCSWEPESNLTNCSQILEAFRHRQGLRSRRGRRAMEGDNVMNIQLLPSIPEEAYDGKEAQEAHRDTRRN